jgi:hypothetical protein
MNRPIPAWLENYLHTRKLFRQPASDYRLQGRSAPQDPVQGGASGTRQAREAGDAAPSPRRG